MTAFCKRATSRISFLQSALLAGFLALLLTSSSSAFDPRISPHLYVNGIGRPPSDPSSPDGGEEESVPASEKVGVLIIDHGSRREKSNQHLQAIAEMYATHPRCPPHFVVAAAHMEIASPTIEEGIRGLVTKHGVGSVVCLPYFLSPGRHMTEDVPKLVEDVARNLDIEVVLADHVGTSPGMINAIGEIVERTVRHQLGKKNRDGGFLIELAKMMEDQAPSEDVGPINGEGTVGGGKEEGEGEEKGVFGFGASF